jgi:murein endopeptidase
VLVSVSRRYAAREPGELPLLIGDLSRPRGGNFGAAYGIVGHSTHQNGLDADVYYPRTDRRPSAPETVTQVNRRLAQRLVDLFVDAGAEKVLVGPNLGLRGPAGVVVPYPRHDNHLHVRIRNPDA